MPDFDPKHQKLGELLRQLPKETPREDFDARFWKRFELEKDIPLPRSPWGSRPIMNPALALTAAGILSLLLVLRVAFPLDRPFVNIMHGNLSVTGHDRITHPLTTQYRLKEGDQFKTNGSNWVVIELNKGYRIQINPNSDVAVINLKRHNLPGKTVLSLSKGQALISIGDEINRKYPLEIRTPNAFAKAMGTQFLVSSPSANDRQSKISVLRGVVQVGSVIQNRQIIKSSVFVSSGEQTIVADNLSPLKPQAMVEQSRLELEELFQFSKKNRVILLLSMSPQRTRELLRPCAIYIRLESKYNLARDLEAIAKSIEEASENLDIQQHLEAAQAFEKAIEDQAGLDRVPVLLFIGAYYSYLKQYEEAVRIFENIALEYPNSYFSSLSLMAAAILYDEKLHSSVKAVSLAHEILKKYPQSYEAAEATSLINRKSLPTP